MEDAKRQLVQNWLIKAQHDLATARKLSTAPDPYAESLYTFILSLLPPEVHPQ